MASHWFGRSKKENKKRERKSSFRNLMVESLESRNLLAVAIIDDGDSGYSEFLPTNTIDDGATGYSEYGTWYNSGLGGGLS